MEEYILIFLTSSIFSLGVAAGLAFIPANIAKRKGYSFGLWWFYGWMIFIAAIIHVNFIPDKNSSQYLTSPNNPESKNRAQDVAEELIKYKNLMDQGALSAEEFSLIKTKLMKYL